MNHLKEAEYTQNFPQSMRAVSLPLNIVVEHLTSAQSAKIDFII
jgi:hypothetical protein